MGWFLLFAATVLALYFWREYRVQQQDLQRATAPHRAGERYIGQVLTLADGIRAGGVGSSLASSGGRCADPTCPPGRTGRGVTGVDGRVLIVDRLSD